MRQFKLVNYLKRRKGRFASYYQGLLNVRTHIILLPVSHLSHNHHVYLFRVLGRGGEEISRTQQKITVLGFQEADIHTDVKLGNEEKVNLEISIYAGFKRK